ncbi:uncharacterized protein [Watersipora subatra]|uniref:uncharacterized protein n=1 Tax=Watersipora subatra TaxID=2589382 RepID=UPI00355B1A26
MGSRISHRSSAPSRDTENANKSASTFDAKSARQEFQSQVKKLLTKSNPSAGHLRLDIKGQVDKYPFWISKSALKRESTRNKEIEYLMIKADKATMPCPPKLPNNLHCHVNKTLRLILKYKKSSISELKQELYPEHDVIIKCITKLLLKVSIVGDGGQPSQLKFQIYEHHRNVRTGRRPMRMREMKVERVLFDQHNNMAIIGNEFALIIHKVETEQEHITDSSLQVSGAYIRLLDTCPSAVITFNYRDAGQVEDIILPASISHSHEYTKRLLSKSSSNPFKLKLSRIKRSKSKTS